ncbi:MAG TPA: hypothetical protein VF798_06180, partial [Burkholderiaceae bacterium]
MKRITTALLAAMTLAACGTAPAPAGTTAISAAATQQTPAQIAGQICPIATAVVTTLSSPLAPLTIGEKAAVAEAGPIIATACTLGANIDLSNYRSLTKAVPQLIAAFENSAALSEQARSNLLLLQVI